MSTLAIVNTVRTSHRCIAVCEWCTYDVWGNAKDGFEVNDKYNQGLVEIPVTMYISNVPDFPGAKDERRQFSDSGSFYTDMIVSFTLDDKDIKKALGITKKIEVDGDDKNYYINLASNGKPLAELTILNWKSYK